MEIQKTSNSQSNLQKEECSPHFAPDKTLLTTLTLHIFLSRWYEMENLSMHPLKNDLLKNLVSWKYLIQRNPKLIASPRNICPGSRSILNKWTYSFNTAHVQFSSVAQLCLTLCNPMDCSTPGLPDHHQLPEFSQTHAFELVMPSNHLILCRPLLFPPSIFPSIRVFSNKSALGWCKSNCDFALLNFAVWYWNVFLSNKCDYILHHFYTHFLFYVFC